MELAPPPHTFLFADLVGFTTLTAAHGDERGADVATRFHAAIRGLVGDESQAAEMKTLGDGVMIRSTDAAQAVLLGLAIAETSEELEDVPAVRVGIHTGPAVHRDGDWYGTTVNVASRLCEQAAVGQVLVSEETTRAAGRPAGVHFSAPRPHRLKHLADPVPARTVLPSAPMPASAPHPLDRLRRPVLHLLTSLAGHRIHGAH